MDEFDIFEMDTSIDMNDGDEWGQLDDSPMNDDSYDHEYFDDDSSDNDDFYQDENHNDEGSGETDTLNPETNDFPAYRAKTIPFGMNPIALQSAAELKNFASRWEGTPLAAPLHSIADWLSGVNKPGMEVIVDQVCEVSNFFHIDPVNVCYEHGEPGIQWSGFTNQAYDNWIGGDPNAIKLYASQYGDLFPVGAVSHEIGHHLVDRLMGEIPRVANEACSDYVTGLYFGAKNLDPSGMAEFFADHGGGNYPSNRDEIFMEGYQKANTYAFSDFQAIIDYQRFNLYKEFSQIIQRYH